MAKRRIEKNSAPSVVSTDASIPASGSPEGWWPTGFLAPRPTAIIVAAGLFASILIGLLMVDNGLVGAKQLFAYLLGLQNPYDIGVPATSRDAGGVLIGLIWVIIGLAIHPAAGLCVLLLLRPWIDGYSFQTDNMYFVWGLALCCMVWGVRTVMRGTAVRAWLPALLFAAYPFIGLLLSGRSIYYYDTYRALILWTTYVFTFFLVANLATNPKVRRILIAVILLSIVAEAVFAIMQYRYILPFLRGMIQQDPNIVRTMFGADPDSPELTRRFNVNRAWGTVLFPNALAAFLITWIPLLVACLWNNVLAWREMSANTDVAPALNAGQRRRIVGMSVGLWLGSTVVLYLLFQFPITYLPPSQLPGYLGPTGAIVTSLLLALLPAAGIHLLAVSRGLGTAFVVGRTALYSLGLLVCLWALTITFSRGGLLALSAATLFGAALCFLPTGRILAIIPSFLKRLALPLAASVAIILLAAQAPLVNTGELAAQPDAASTENAALHGDASVAVTVEGQNVSARDLVDPATFRARFGYWQVAARVFAAYPMTGVGLGAFSWAYPNFQFLGPADVQIAHNAYLQALCETGILGGLVLVLFWKAVVLTGAMRYLAETNAAERRIYLGLTVGLLAFLMHSFIDINFSHPTLMMFAVVAAGLIFALAPEAEATPSRLGPLLVLPLLVVVALCSGMALRVFKQHAALSRAAMLDVASDREAETRFSVAKYFLQDCREASEQKKRPGYIYFASARTMITDPKVLTSLGGVFTVTPDRKAQPLRTGELIPEDALLAVNKPWKAVQLGVKAAQAQIAELEAIDAMLPYDSQLAMRLAEYYMLLASATTAAEFADVHGRAVEAMVRWADEAVRRNPNFAGSYSTKCNAYWRRASLTKGKTNYEDYEVAWQSMKRAAELAPVIPKYWGTLGPTGEALATAYDQAGLHDKAKATRDEAQVAADYAGKLIAERVRRGIDPAPRPKKNETPGAPQL